MSSAIETPLEERLPTTPKSSAAAVDPADELPVTIIERRPTWQIVDLSELWRYHELLFFLTWRDVKVRYKQTVLGAAWSVLQPLTTMIVFAVFLGRLAGVSQNIDHYALFVFAGMLPWTFFANSVTAAANSVVGNQNLVTKVYFPRLIIPMSAVGAGLVDFAVALGMLAAMILWYGVLPSWGFLLLPVIVLLMVVAALGIGTFLAALTVAYRDFRHVVPFGIQLWMFSTPCIYLNVAKMIGPRSELLLPLNPVYGLILNFRQAALGRPLDWYALMISGAVSIVILVLGCVYFRNVERSFADII